MQRTLERTMWHTLRRWPLRLALVGMLLMAVLGCQANPPAVRSVQPLASPLITAKPLPNEPTVTPYDSAAQDATPEEAALLGDDARYPTQRVTLGDSNFVTAACTPSILHPRSPIPEQQAVIPAGVNLIITGTVRSCATHTNVRLVPDPSTPINYQRYSDNDLINADRIIIRQSDLQTLAFGIKFVDTRPTKIAKLAIRLMVGAATLAIFKGLLQQSDASIIFYAYKDVLGSSARFRAQVVDFILLTPISASPERYQTRPSDGRREKLVGVVTGYYSVSALNYVNPDNNTRLATSFYHTGSGALYVGVEVLQGPIFNIDGPATLGTGYLKVSAAPPPAVTPSQ